MQTAKAYFGNAVSTKAGTVPRWAKSITADGTRHSTVGKPGRLSVSQAVSELFTGISGAAYQHQRPLLHFSRLHPIQRKGHLRARGKTGKHSRSRL